jgi:hypothetical protein
MLVGEIVAVLQSMVQQAVAARSSLVSVGIATSAAQVMKTAHRANTVTDPVIAIPVDIFTPHVPVMP